MAKEKSSVIDALATDISQAIGAGDGVWRTCSGCYETVDGHPCGSYPYSEVFMCTLGSGCGECGGIGAVWDTTDYADMGQWMGDYEQPITETWLKEVGFKWHQLDRQPEKHWLLWLGDAEGMERYTSFEDLGIELATMEYLNRNGELMREGEGWFCWLRSDCAHRYSRFLHVRHLRYRRELIALVEALTGQRWNPDNHLYGGVRSPAAAAQIRDRETHFDQQLMKEGYPWCDIEKGDSRGGALPEHMQENIDRGGK